MNEILEEGRYVKRARGFQNKTKINSIRALKLLNTNLGQLQINKTLIIKIFRLTNKSLDRSSSTNRIASCLWSLVLVYTLLLSRYRFNWTFIRRLNPPTEDRYRTIIPLKELNKCFPLTPISKLTWKTSSSKNEDDGQ